MNLVAVTICIAIGASLIVIRTLNMLLGNRIGIYGSNLVNHITGIIGSIAILAVLMMLGFAQEPRLAEIPWYALLGGILGCFFVILSNYTFSKTSVITSTILILAGQFLCALGIDAFLLHIHLKPVNIIGAVIICLAVVLYNYGEGESKEGHNQ